MRRPRVGASKLMDEFSITRPEPATPASDTGGRGAARGDAKERRRPRHTPEPETPEGHEPPADDDDSHQVDELA